ncbi:MAG: nodulation protein NfeD [Dehalococcoidales bacterium]|jgi:membrane-bound serine protease (ClpP class)|nr:nodulation protein NfeD [Dehalococcoidales bacterium]MDP7285876.1 nodulation protein NfeD [Dehalococcoidales bacterium]MDP7415872.1 nodulation protein NfeD [Dehalococcoidales bacterium]
MLRFLRIPLILTGLLLIASITVEAQAVNSRIDVLQVKGTINPVLVDYISRGIDQAEVDGAQAVIIQMDTPGGLDTAMRDIIQEITNARIPVVVYVSPAGARAASAGAYITLAAHIAAMAPNTAIGAATPVAMGEGGEAQMSDEMKAKIINDAIAYIRDTAESHGRNADWAEKAVREGVSATSQEALELNVIDMLAPNLEALVVQLNGHQVPMLDGSVVTLNTQGAPIKTVAMKAIERFLYTIADPNIAFILLSLASLGIMMEIFNPGLIFPGVLGAICGVMAFYSLGQLPVNIAGILLIVLAFGFFIGEVLTTTFGIFTAGGVVALVMGALILFQGASPVFRVDPWLIAIVTILIASVFAFVINRALRAHRKQASTGREDLIGKRAVVKVALDPEGTVFFKGERWAAVSNEELIELGEEVTITGIDGLTLQVIRKQ